MSCVFNKNKLNIIVIVLFLFPNFVFAQGATCSPKGYSIYTINGVLTDERAAQENKKSLQDLLTSTYKNQPLTVDFLYNPTHGLGVDGLETSSQIVFDQFSYNVDDYDFAQMLTDASAKLKTQKVLLVGHSQGNFYANDFYDTVADEQGGIPSSSIGVYGVGTPASHVAGGGAYLTSSTDKVISGLVARGLSANILPANVRINFSPSDDSGLGHDFSKVYLNYAGDKIISDVKSSLDKLTNNNIQDPFSPCLNPPKLTIAQKVQGAVLATVDGSAYVANGITYGLENAYMAFLNGTGSFFADTFRALAGKNVAEVIDATIPDTTNQVEDITPSAVVKETPALKPKIAEATSPSKDTQATPVVETIVSVVENKKIEADTEVVKQDLATEKDLYPNLLPGGGGVAASFIDTTPLPPAPPLPPPPAPDTTAPVITILGTSPLTVLFGSIYLDAGATAVDDVDGVVNVVTNGSVNTGAVGDYTITYTATDVAGNVAIMTRTVHVKFFASSYLENLQLSLPATLSAGELLYCADTSLNAGSILTFGSIFPVSAGGINLDSIGVRGLAGSRTVNSAHLYVYPWNGPTGFHAAISFGARMTLPLGSLIATSDAFNPSSWSSVDATGTNPLDFPYDNIYFPHVFLPEGNYFMTFGDCPALSVDYFGVKASGNGFTPLGYQALFYSVSNTTLHWDHLGGFGFDFIINGAF